jgi:DoxX-like family
MRATIDAANDEDHMTFADSHPIACQWAGEILSALAALALFADAAQIFFARERTKAELAATGFPESAAPALGTIALVCAILYAIPQTAVLGAILTTGFLGGAICTHFRLGRLASPPQFASLVLGLMAWGGLYLRNADLRALLPFVD